MTQEGRRLPTTPEYRHRVAADPHTHPRWDRGEPLGTPIGELIDGLDVIATHAVPYTLLPRRWQDYAEEFPTWAHFAAVTPQHLLHHDKINASALRALAAVARDAVHAHRHGCHANAATPHTAATALLQRLGPDDRTILDGRVWAPEPVPQQQVAASLGVSPLSVYRNQLRAEARFADLLAEPAHRMMGDYAAALRVRLGPYLPTIDADEELRRDGVDPGSQLAHLLLHLAGPYVRRGDWLGNVTAAGSTAAADATAAVFRHNPAPTPAALMEALTGLGMSATAAHRYLDTHLQLRHIGGVCVQMEDTTTADLIETVLHALNSPMAADELHAVLGPDGPTLIGIRRTLSDDDRFVRVSRRTWGLRGSGLAEYSGIAHALGAYIDAHGGHADLHALVSTFSARYPDVARTSIERYVANLEFVVEAGIVRRRRRDDRFPAVPPLHTVRGAFRNGDTEIRLVRTCTSEVLRGSGLMLPPAASSALGVQPGQQRRFTSPHGGATITWSLSSPGGAGLTSLRSHALALGAAEGDTLILTFDLSVSTFQVTRVDPALRGISRLQTLVGHPILDPAVALSRILECEPHTVVALLQRRGDHDLASLADTGFVEN